MRQKSPARGHTAKTQRGRGPLVSFISIVKGSKIKFFSVATESCIDLSPMACANNEKLPSIHRPTRALLL
ncbi:hypothetical protein M413DRAFT_404377 [Hebeloma cylindrosporum]|uniref:Uncharacterized protein n=1 Tax=Hebeloma cylindrosporum TaxID=76867 RepID=A0A0C2X9Q6_HEBCY|nr:hypothetical protein M413DRAFT_404377 [Hebeloma cylindrosporum h7]